MSCNLSFLTLDLNEEIRHLGIQVRRMVTCRVGYRVKVASRSHAVGELSVALV